VIELPNLTTSEGRVVVEGKVEYGATDMVGAPPPDGFVWGGGDRKETSFKETKMSDSQEKQEEYDERYRRWQDIRIQQLGFVNNLFIGLSSLAVVWQGQAVLAKDVALGRWSAWAFAASAVLLLFSLIIGCLTAWNRLIDIRQTAQAALYRKKGQHGDAKKLSDANDKLGDRTWLGLMIQGGAFLAGAFSSHCRSFCGQQSCRTNVVLQDLTIAAKQICLEKW